MKLSVVIILLGLTLSVAQPGTDFPWMQELRLEKTDADLTYQEIVDAGNAYWLTHDKDKKGSGYKPFMRWVEKAKAYVKEDGTLQTAADIQTIIQQRDFLKSGLTNNSNWSASGPFSVVGTTSWSTGTGRVNTVIVDPNNPNTYYIGAPAGGIWKSTDAGVTWNPLSDFLSQIGVSAIAIDPTDSNIIYIGTGDDDANDSLSIGLMKSTDGGLTWNTTGLVFPAAFAANISEVYIDSNDHNKIFVSSNRGFYRSTNAGASFSTTQFGNIKDIKLKPGDSNTIYLTTSNAFYKSTDNGVSFTQVASGLPSGMARSVIAVTPANANYVYLLIINNSANLLGLYRSTDSGTTFTQRDNGTDILESQQGFFDLALEASPTNAETIYTGCLNIWKSTNGGASFFKINSWSNPSGSTYTHADIHQIRQFGNELFTATDGGIYRSTNDGGSFTDLTTTAQIGQFYRVAVSAQSSSEMVGGLQDNGGQSNNFGVWKNFYGADGMDGGIDPTDSNIRYGFIQNGGGLYVTSNGGSSLQGSISIPSGEFGNWVTPLKTDSQGNVYAGYSSLYKVDNNAFNFVPVSSSFNNNIDAIEIDPNNDNTIFVAVNSVLYRSLNAGINFSFVENFPDDITAIEVSHDDNNTVYVATAFSTGQVYKSIDQGNNFSDITSNLPFLGKNTIAHYPGTTDGEIYVGTTVGVYKYQESSGQWIPYNTNLPNVNVTDLEINANDYILTAATYGRGIWQTAVDQVASNEDIDNSILYKVYPNPSNGQFYIEWNNSTTFDYQVYDLTGKTILSKKNNTGTIHTLNLSDVSRGVYLLNITTENGIKTEKIVIQ